MVVLELDGQALELVLRELRVFTLMLGTLRYAINSPSEDKQV